MPNTTRYRVLLTGASRGIGKAMALALSGKAERLFLLGRDLQALRNVASLISGTEVIVLAGDLAEASFRSDVQQAVSVAGGIDVLINNAGISDFSAFEHQDVSAIETLVQVNLLAPMQLSRQLLPLMLREPEAQIINIGSTFSYIGFPGFASYAATKFGLRGFTEALGRELADTSVRVRLFSPRATKTEINTPAVTRMNAQLGTTEDDPADVAQQFLAFLSTRQTEYRVGFPEKLFAKINQTLPGLVSQSLRKQLPVIRQALSSLSSKS
jgi:short-subunit dehydrogenase